jgi:hypothetical protein
MTISARAFQVRVLQEQLTSRISSQDDFIAFAIIAGQIICTDMISAMIVQAFSKGLAIGFSNL